ncbi:MAG: hypothetical protein ABIR81_09250 [Ginsengibacter sp.]
MKKLYPILIICFGLLQAGCSKDILKSYDKRIHGSWKIIDVDKFGIGGSISSLAFKEGSFVFRDDGKLEYTNIGGEKYSGSWNVRKKRLTGRCSTNENGSRNCDDKTVQSLGLTAVNFTTQEVKSEFFDDLQFTSTNRFKAFIYSGTQTYVFRFLRL